jgi:hypothetical protein
MNSLRSNRHGLLPGCAVDGEVKTVLAKCPSDPSGMVVESVGAVNREDEIPGLRKREDFGLRDV